MAPTLPPVSGTSRSGTTLELPPVPGGGLRRAVSLVRLWSGTPGVQPAAASAPLDRFLYGLAQPLLGLRLMLRSHRLLGEGLAPSCLVGIICIAAATRGNDPSWSAMGVLHYLGRFMVLFAALAPVPPFLFARYYARVAARARNRMGFGPCEPYLKPVLQSASETLKMLIILAIGVAPLTWILGLIPMWGQIAGGVLTMTWSLYWIVVEAYDNSRTLAPGETVAQRESAARALRHTPAFLGWLGSLPRPLSVVFLPVRMVAEIVHGLAKEWMPEIVEVERTPWVSAGFAVGTAVLLAIPGVNLTFRPAVAIGGVHLRARLEHESLGRGEA